MYLVKIYHRSTRCATKLNVRIYPLHFHRFVFRKNVRALDRFYTQFVGDGKSDNGTRRLVETFDTVFDVSDLSNFPYRRIEELGPPKSTRWHAPVATSALKTQPLFARKNIRYGCIRLERSRPFLLETATRDRRDRIDLRTKFQRA